MASATDSIPAAPEEPGESGQLPPAAPDLPTAERDRLLVEWNQTDRDYPRDRSIHQLFAEQAAKTPGAEAVVFTGGSLTYGELDARADQLAGRLRRLGVGHGAFVALCLDRSPEMVIALMAILKAGGAYVPLDPAYPEARLGFMLRDSRAPLLVTLEKWRTTFAAAGVRLLCLDSAAEVTAEETSAGLETPVGPEDPAYVVYTSGSTGQPKGVLVPHRGVVRLVRNPNYVTLGPEEAILQLAPLSFDASTFELWGALLNGGRVVLAPPGLPSLGEIGETIRRYRVTTLWLTAGLFHLMVDEHLADLKPLRQLLAGGDVLSPEHMLKAYRALPGCRLINGYGPTENTTFTCCHAITGEQEVVPSVPIGRPISNTQVYVLDAQLRPVPIGVAGELYAGGDGVALGYLNDPELTAARFIPDPFRPGKGGRLYRTGDRVRWRPDGHLEFLGRLDQQVKIRGFRVETGEIEAALRTHPGVADCAVVAQSGSGGSGRSLTAFVVGRTPDAWSDSGLRTWLGERLPGHLVPSHFSGLGALPLTPNGKVDRGALEVREVGRPDPDADHLPPRTSLEHRLAALWQKLLRRNTVGVRDNFFSLGGDSLSAMRLLVEVERQQGARLSLALFFQTPTIEALARLLETNDPGKSDLRLEAQAPGEPLLMSYEQRAFWLRSHLDEQPSVHNIHHAVWLRGSLDVPALRQALGSLLERQSGLRLSFPLRQDRSEAAYWPVADLLEVVDLSRLPPAERTAQLDHRLRLQAATSFDLREERLLRLELIRLEDRTHVLSLTLHHILGDAWSLAIWDREWPVLYAAALRHVPAQLPSLPLRYTDYAAWQRRYQSGERLERLQDYWTGQLHDAPQLMGLPTDFSRPPRPAGRGESCRIDLSRELHQALARTAQRHDCSVFMALFGAFNTLLYRYSGRTDLCVGVPMANRRHAETQHLIGLFLSIVAVRTRLDGDLSFAGLLQRVRRDSLAAQDHADLPFAHVLRALGTAPRQDHNPYFQVLFNWVALPTEGDGQNSCEPDLAIQPVQGITEVEANAVSNLDMVLTLEGKEDGGIAINWSYAPSLYKADTVRFLASSFRCLLEQAVANPETLLRHFNLADTGTTRHPLSLGQQGIWVDQMLHPDVPLYNIGGHVHLPGPLDVECFHRAVELLVARHDCLRLRLTRSRDEAGLPQQTVVPPHPVAVPLYDFRGKADPDAAARRWMQRRFVEPFELEGQPLFRYDLVRVADAEHYCLMQYHHLVADGWSLALFNRSLAELYGALRQGRSAGATSFSYLDQVAEDQRYLASEVWRQDQAYWRQEYPFVPEPLLQPRSSGPGLAGSDCHTVQLPQELYRRLGLLAGQHQASTFHVFIGVLAVYFARTQACGELVIGLPMLNRTKAAFKETGGLFASVCPVRFAVRTDGTFAELLSEIGRTLRAAYRRQRFPVGEINRMVKPTADHRQIYDVGLSFESQDYDAQFDTITSRMEHLLHGCEQSPLMIYVRDIHAAADVRLDFVTNRAFFTAAEVRVLQDCLRHLLECVCAHADTPIRTLPLVTDAQYHRLVREWNRTAVDFGAARTVQSLFEDQAARTPDAVALLSKEGRLTYAELNARANQLARRLIALGVRPDVLVAVVMERSFELVVSLLGVLKAGGVYVPIDAANPAERIRQLLTDCAAPILLTVSHLQPVLETPSGLLDVLVLDRGGWSEGAPASGNPATRTEPGHLAYAIYTSGSTGRPKAVAISQRSLANLLQAMRRILEVEEGTRLLGVASPAFDISVAEILLPLIAGGTAVLVGERTAADPALLARWIGESQPHIIQATPATWAALLDFGWPGFHAADFITTAEALPEAVGSQLLWRCRRLWDLYGPTETTIWSLYRQVTPGRISGLIGRPIANTSVHILDQHGQPLPVGVAGELHIGGVGLAREYLNRPELTAEKFIPDPFAEAPGARLYRTGDRCRWNAEGEVEFLGRLDHQVKLRGYRIELGEIEAALGQHPAVARSAVLLREDQPGDKRLVGYVVLAPAAVWNITDLARHLGSRLPRYMIPAALVRLERLPLTPNGKLDRRALPAPDASRPDMAMVYVPPGDAIETQLVAIWCELLGVNRVGVHDNFFDLGGHSLLAVRLSATIERQFGRKLPVAILFQAPTVRLLAAWVSGKEEVKLSSSLVPLQPLGAKPPLFLVHGWGGDVFCYLSIAAEMAPDQPVYGVQALGLETRTTPHATVEEMAAHYVREIRTFQPEGPYYLGGHSLGGIFAFEVARQLRQAGQRVALLVLFDTNPIGVVPWPIYLLRLLLAIPVRCQVHFRNMRRMSNRKRLEYLRGRVAFVREWVNRNRSRPSPPPAPAAAEPPPPLVLEHDDYYYTVALAYKIRPGPGSADVFICADSLPIWKWYWRYIARGGARFHQVPGAHDTIITPGHVSTTAKVLRALLQRIHEREKPVLARPSGSHAGRVP
jgi:amino acid adenylation domain-containing protein